jgi:hypothetical protein
MLTSQGTGTPAGSLAPLWMILLVSSTLAIASAIPSIPSAEQFGAMLTSQGTGTPAGSLAPLWMILLVSGSGGSAPDPGVYPDWTQTDFIYT